MSLDASLALQALQICLKAQPYRMDKVERQRVLTDGLFYLNRYHYNHCEKFRYILDGYWPASKQVSAIEELPFLPASLFKTQELRSVPEEDIRVTIASSGTSGQVPSRIFVDKETSALQQQALVSSLMHVIGKKRLPMLIIDSARTVSDRQTISARSAGILGTMRFGHSHCFALDDSLAPNREAIDHFLHSFGGEPFLIFGFTFMVWSGLYEPLARAGLDLSNGLLIHSGGWKKMIEHAVDNDRFRKELNSAFGLKRIYNFYGMAEQLGSIFLEGSNGLLYAPNCSEVVIRDPVSWEVVVPGQVGLVQVLSLLPRSYPGHSILTEDLGFIEESENRVEGLISRGIRLTGRLKKAEIRGCSDTASVQV
jgi:Acyl-protein synthetase, LuxE